MATAADMTKKKDSGKQKALDSALAQIERQFGKGSIMKMGADNPAQEIESTSTGSIGLDIALGIGGVPKGRIVEIYGPESSGKTTLTLHCIAEEQKKGGVCAFVDAEHALDPIYARKLGVDLDELLISQPDTGEQGLEIVDTLVRSGAVSMVVVDSVAALTPKSELEGDMGDSSVGVQARLMSQAMRKLTGSINRSGCTVIFINQIRMKIGVMFGSPETTSARSKTATKLLVMKPASKWLKTKWPRRSKRWNLTLCTAKAFLKRVSFWILAPKRALLINRALGIPTGMNVLVKVVKTLRNSCAITNKWRSKSKIKFGPLMGLSSIWTLPAARRLTNPMCLTTNKAL
jgi:RecA/RadA recombinase